MRVLITGGAGFVGASLAQRFAASGAKVTAFDNLRRRGSELNLPLLKRAGIAFAHGDIRSPADLEELTGNFDLFIDACAEPSVLAGLDGGANYLVQTNLVGTLNALEFARRRCDQLIFLSTSRVYSIAPLRELTLKEEATRLVLGDVQCLGAGPRGISERFPTHLPRSLYGATKLASELLIQEYAQTYGLKAVINRCGVLAGPGQFGKVDQGVFTLWVASHHFGLPLRYTGFGGTGKQVRDLLHPDDLFDLLVTQQAKASAVTGEIFNVGGGPEKSTSLLELTALCREVTGREVPVASVSESASVDVPWYVTDAAKVQSRLGWKPRRSVRDIVEGISAWLRANEDEVRPLFA